MDSDSPLTSKDTSLVIRASQILALIIAFGLAGMIASIVISESINNNSEQIRHANSLRTLATKISSSQIEGKRTTPEIAIARFQQHLEKFHPGVESKSKNSHAIDALLNEINEYWPKIKNGTATTTEVNNFSETIDGLVHQYQQQTIADIYLLRLIQYGGFFILVLISYITIYSLQNSIIQSLKLLMIRRHLEVYVYPEWRKKQLN